MMSMQDDGESLRRSNQIGSECGQKRALRPKEEGHPAFSFVSGNGGRAWPVIDSINPPIPVPYIIFPIFGIPVPPRGINSCTGFLLAWRPILEDDCNARSLSLS